MHALITSFNGFSNLGLFAYANDKFALVGKEIPEEICEQIKSVLKVPVHRINIAGTSLIGIFVAGNNQKILVPGICFEEELRELQELGINYEVFNTKLTCLGNNMLVGEQNAIINPEFTDAEAKKISTMLNLEVKKTTMSGLNAIGSIAVLNQARKSALVSNELKQQEINMIEKIFDVNATPGSVNMGSPYIKPGVFCNKNGFVMGKQSGGPELSNADEALGFLEEEI